jgi:hypothetical protein
MCIGDQGSNILESLFRVKKNSKPRRWRPHKAKSIPVLGARDVLLTMTNAGALIAHNETREHLECLRDGL